MVDTLSPPNRERLVSAFDVDSSITTVDVLGEDWVRVTNSERSLLVCVDAKTAADSNRLVQGAGLIEKSDAGVVFVTPPTVYALGISEPYRGTADVLIATSTEEFVTELVDFLSQLLTNGFEEYPTISRANLIQLFANILTDEEDEIGEIDQDLEPDPHRGGFPPTWPSEIEDDIIELIISWILRENPRSIVDLCSDGWGLTPALAKYRDERGKDAELYVLDLPVPAANIGRLVTAYRFSHHHPVDVSEYPFEAFLDDLDEQAELGDFDKSDEDLQSPDAVVSGLCSGNRRDVDSNLKDRASGLGLPMRIGLSSYLAAEGMRSLGSKGRGAFVLTLGELVRPEFIQYVFETGRIHTILLLDSPEETILAERPELTLVVVLFEKKDTNVNSDEIRLIEIETSDFDDRIHRLIQAPANQVSSDDAAEIDGISFTFVTPADLLELNAKLVLREPQLVPFLRDDETNHLGDLVEEIRRGVRTDANDFFYFEPNELHEIDIPIQFLTPVLKSGPRFSDERSHTITSGQADLYALDLREFLDELDDPTEETVLEELRHQGFDSVATYIENHRHLAERPQFRQSGIWFCPFDRLEDDPPDLLIGQFSDGTWYRYHADDMIIDQRWYGVWCGDINPDTLHKLLSSEPYQQLFEHFGHQISQLHLQYNRRDIERLPINTGPLNAGLQDIVFPPERRRDQRHLDRAVIERCDDRSAREALETLLDPDDRFAWAWFLSPNEYEQFKQQYEQNETDAREFVTDRLDEKEIREMLDDIAESPLHVERWETIEELAKEFQEGRYRLFLYGATPQFEGFIMDWARRNGHEVVWRDSRPYVLIRGQTDEDKIPKGLGALIETFIPRGFGDFLQDNITDLRNTITHGEIVEASHERAAICLLALHTLTLQITEERLGIDE